ncbi:MAG: amino acid-binding protein [Micropruina sp.]
MFLLRVVLPDRPGSLGAVATAMGTVGADINAVEIVEKYQTYAVDDFMVEIPQGTLPDMLITACESISGVKVLWFSYYPESWGLQSDVDVLNDMTENPERAEDILIQAAPAVFRCHWALKVDQTTGAVLARTDTAPDDIPDAVSLLAPLTEVHLSELDEGWLPSWPETLIAVAPFKNDSAIVLARKGGPEFIKSELARLRHLAALAQ